MEDILTLPADDREPIPPPIVAGTDWEPTDATPGTEAKILVMRDRAGRKQPIFHPGDVRIWDRYMDLRSGT